MSHKRRKIDLIRDEFESEFITTEDFEYIASSIDYNAFKLNPCAKSSELTMYDGYTNPVVDSKWEVFLINKFRQDGLK